MLVLSNRQDTLFTMPEMERADRILAEVYKKAGAPRRHYRTNFYDGPHKFDREMQKDAFAWFDRWLKTLARTSDVEFLLTRYEEPVVKLL